MGRAYSAGKALSPATNGIPQNRAVAQLSTRVPLQGQKSRRTRRQKFCPQRLARRTQSSTLSVPTARLDGGGGGATPERIRRHNIIHRGSSIGCMGRQGNIHTANFLGPAKSPHAGGGPHHGNCKNPFDPCVHAKYCDCPPPPHALGYIMCSCIFPDWQLLFYGCWAA